MNIILVSKKNASRSVQITQSRIWVVTGLLTLGLMSILLLGGWAGYAIKSHANNIQAMSAQEDIQALEQQSEEYVSVMAARVAKLQARVMRLDALGARLAKGADLDDGEFDFSAEPAQGGFLPDEWAGEIVSTKELKQMVDTLDTRVQDREEQLGVLDGFIAEKQLAFNQYLSGLPVKGSVTSGYGYRIHPVTGRRAMHSGIDIAAKYSTDIVVPASGVVKFSGWKGGYGRTIDIDHGNGLVTRYAHNSMNIVEEGEAVKKGDLIGLVGSSGRSTGPHVHFEVIKNGKSVNPWHYVTPDRGHL